MKTLSLYIYIVISISINISNQDLTDILCKKKSYDTQRIRGLSSQQISLIYIEKKKKL